jgi:membrane protease YdiL (CAAX protease family)
MLRLVRSSPLLLFFVLAFAFTWAYWVPRALASRGWLDVNVPDALAVVAGYGPALAAVIVTALTSGRTGLRELGRRLVLWRVGVQWWGAALGLHAAMTLAALGLHLFSGGATPSAGQPPALLFGEPGTPLWQQILFLTVIFTLGFDGLGEEVGWRGFALPRLLARYRALTASLIFGALWWLWHLPIALTLGTALSDEPFYSNLSWNLAASILFTWIFNHTHGSVLLAIIFHAANNLSGNILPAVIPAVQDVGVWGIIVPWAVALAVIVFAGPAHLGPEGPPGIDEAAA